MKGIFIFCLVLFGFTSLAMGQAARDEWVLMSPVGDVQVEQFKIAKRIPDFNGKTVGLFWNGKPNGDVFLNEVADALTAKFPGVKIVRMWDIKPVTRTAWGNSEEDVKFMAANADLVIGASAD
jgi:hypothetical protein